MNNGFGRALLIEADEPYRAAMANLLQLVGCQVEQVSTTERGFAALESHSCSLVVWGLSTGADLDRAEVISELRLRTEAPLILVDEDQEMAQFDLEAGADQWLPKPFVPGFLVASVRAALRKSSASILPPALRLKVRGMMLDGSQRTLTFGGRRVDLTRQEWQLLAILISHPNRFLSAREILSQGWRAGDHEAEQLRTYVHRLRQKLAPLNLPCRLRSQHGHGYILVFDDDDNNGNHAPSGVSQRSQTPDTP